jgi:2-polyprenyl-6-methoxyphenol hydroxylase-like FAD-dependent oxidoreductase
VLLLDRARFPREKPCSESLNPGAVAALRRLGPDVVREVLEARPARLAGFRIHAPSGAAMLGRYAADEGGGQGLALPRRVLDDILVRAAARAGAAVREHAAVEDLARADGAVTGVVARTPRGTREMITARVVVGADGLRSVVARRMGRRIRRRAASPSRPTAGVAGLDAVGEMHIGHDGYVGLGPIGRAWRPSRWWYRRRRPGAADGSCATGSCARSTRSPRSRAGCRRTAWCARCW